jgi:hypothetical protein
MHIDADLLAELGTKDANGMIEVKDGLEMNFLVGQK